MSKYGTPQREMDHFFQAVTKTNSHFIAGLQFSKGFKCNFLSLLIKHYLRISENQCDYSSCCRRDQNWAILTLAADEQHILQLICVYFSKNHIKHGTDCS